MIFQMCSVRDRAADCFAQPMFVPTIGMAVRAFSDEVNRQDDKSMLFQHPEDYDLYHLGEYDDNTAKFSENAGGPRMIGIGKDLIRG